MPVRTGMPYWPGDLEPRVDVASTVEGSGCRVSSLHLSSHSGTHIDAPAHFLSGGGGIDRIDPWRLLGPCVVVDMTHVEKLISAREVEPLELAPHSRLLFKTRNGAALRSAEFRRDYVALDVSAARLLVEREVALVGIDYLSIEGFGAPGHPVHKTLLERNVVIVEGVDLAEVEPGPYELIAMPLRVVDGDGSPARVLLGRSL
jgi:arylformamidase